ncbi:SDR family oxidoreductase [Nonomuraea indica]|uniref:SDR family oxidoreductase n=1 Tax=Nonomuraea indica TaxID=1581193 RepID=A0ABW8A1D0_9ACTN
MNVSSHQAQRPVRDALPYATAKAAVEGLTRAAAVDHGPQGIRVNAVALGSITTARYEEYRREHPETDQHLAALHPLGHVGRSRFCSLRNQRSSPALSCPSTAAGQPSAGTTRSL